MYLLNLRWLYYSLKRVPMLNLKSWFIGGVFTESAPRFYLPHTTRDLVLPVCGIFFIWDKLREVDNVEQHWLTYISVSSVLYSVWAVFSVQCTMCNLQCAVCRLQRILCNVHCAVYSVLWFCYCDKNFPYFCILRLQDSAICYKLFPAMLQKTCQMFKDFCKEIQMWSYWTLGN